MKKQERSYSERELELVRRIEELHELLSRAVCYVSKDEKELRHKIMQALIKYGEQHDGVYM